MGTTRQKQTLCCNWKPYCSERSYQTSRESETMPSEFETETNYEAETNLSSGYAISEDGWKSRKNKKNELDGLDWMKQHEEIQVFCSDRSSDISSEERMDDVENIEKRNEMKESSDGDSSRCSVEEKSFFTDATSYYS